jgi:hypothetical protein
MKVLGESGRSAERRAIDVSGDDMSNQCRSVTDARDAAIEAGVVMKMVSIAVLFEET